jgi:hypothetical protein
MCDGDHAHDGCSEPTDPNVKVDPAGMSRRGFAGLVAGFTAAATVGVDRLWTGAIAASAAPVVPPTVHSYDGLVPVANAMHIHSSFSEQHASLESQVSEAFGNRNNIVNPGQIVMWQTEHDWREVAHGAPQHIAFTSLTRELVGGKAVIWQQQISGLLLNPKMEIVFDQVSPFDATPGRGAMHLVAQGTGVGLGTLLAYPNFSNSRISHRTNVAGQTISIDVLPKAVDGVTSWMELRVELSYRPPIGNRPAGQYQLSYRFGGSQASVQQQQLLGIVTVPAVPGQWQQFDLDLTSDIAKIWPDMIAEDNSVQDLWLGLSSQSASNGEGYFGNLRFTRSRTANADILATQAAMKAELVARYAGVWLPHGREISFFDRHVNSFGDGAAYLPDYSSYAGAWSNSPGWVESTGFVAQVHAMGGLASFNHPFGTNAKAPTVGPALQAGLARVFADTFTYDLCGADILEVGFQERGGVTIDGGTVVVADMRTHLALWDMHSRNSRWVTGTGVSDNHTAGVKQWAKDKNRFLTFPWAASYQEADLIAALSAGRVFVAELGSFTGALDLQVDGYVPMGAVSVRPDLTTRSLTVFAYNLPKSSTVKIVQGPIDNPGLATPGSGTTVVATLPATAFTTGSATIAIDTNLSSFVRCEVTALAARTVAFSNPIYLLTGPPARPIPVNRTIDH